MISAKELKEKRVEFIKGQVDYHLSAIDAQIKKFIYGQYPLITETQYGLPLHVNDSVLNGIVVELQALGYSVTDSVISTRDGRQKSIRICWGN